MTEIKKEEKAVQVSINADQTTLITLPDETVVAFSPKGDVTLYTDQPVQPTSTDPGAATGNLLSFLDSLKGVSLNGATVEAAVDRFIAAVTTGDITIRHPSAAPGYVKKLEIGEVVDGAMFGGYSPETGKKMFIEQTDEASPMSFRKALRRARKKSRETGQSLHLPTAWEAKTIFNNLAAAGIGGFADTNYWTSSRYHYSCGCMKFLNFKDGIQDHGSKRKKLSVRFMRD